MNHSGQASSASLASPPQRIFTCEDKGETRKDLVSRRETKFAIQGADIGKLRRLLEVNGRRQIYNESVSTVRSIYFDNLGLAACHANLDGLSQRRKVRLRWYDSPLPQESLWLEVKWRSSRVTGKHRALVTSQQPISDLSYKDITNQLLDQSPSRFVPDLLANPEPTVIVEYRREHFASGDGLMRVTIDYDLTFYDQTGKRRVSMAFPFRMRDLVVLEGKTPVGCEQDLPAFLFPLAQRATRCSKYVHACRSLGLILGRD